MVMENHLVVLLLSVVILIGAFYGYTVEQKIFQIKNDLLQHEKEIKEVEEVKDDLESTKQELKQLKVELKAMHTEPTEVKVDLESTRKEHKEVNEELESTKKEVTKENYEHLGGKLVELETSEENEFIKKEVRTRNTGVNGYWIGGYNFHYDNDMALVGRPNQTMSFSDMRSGEPNHPMNELCMVMWRDFGFQWGICLSDPRCCVASYSKGTSTCRIDTSGRCCVETKSLDAWRFIGQKSYLLPSSSVGYLSFGASLYKVVDEQVNWTTAQEMCMCHGGKLAEFETSGENEYIKNELRKINAAVDGYWLGGFNFNKDDDMEWISHPDQVMPFDDMEQGQPNGPASQLCLVHWKTWDYKWGDNFCYDTLPYICEYE